MRHWQIFCNADLYEARLQGLFSQALFPRRCPYCREIAMPSGCLICPDCEKQLSYIRGRRCEKCGKQLQEDGAAPLQTSGNTSNHLCTNCRKHSRSFLFSLALLNYDGISAEIMAGLKYLHKKEYADALAWLLFRHLGEKLRMLGVQAIVPVPVHTKRKKERGYNQAEELGRGLCAFLNVDAPALFRMGLSEEMFREVQRLQEAQESLWLSVKEPGRCSLESGERNLERRRLPVCRFFLLEDMLIRGKNTKAQKALGAAERLMNLQQAFFVSPKYLRCKAAELPEAVLLLDDIYTTGATMEACTRALLSAGVKKVFGLCVCAGRDI